MCIITSKMSKLKCCSSNTPLANKRILYQCFIYITYNNVFILLKNSIVKNVYTRKPCIHIYNTSQKLFARKSASTKNYTVIYHKFDINLAGSLSYISISHVMISKKETRYVLGRFIAHIYIYIILSYPLLLIIPSILGTYQPPILLYISIGTYCLQCLLAIMYVGTY